MGGFDPLRRDLTSLISAYPNVILEKREINLILNGDVETVIQEHKKENEIFSSVFEENNNDLPEEIQDDDYSETLDDEDQENSAI